jgi:hypothetical protein
MSAPRPTRIDAVDLAGGLAITALRAGEAVGRTALRPLRLAARAPVAGARLRRAAAGLATEGRDARTQGRAQLEAAVAGVLVAPEVERTMDRALAGSLTEALGRSLAEHRVAERLAAELVSSGAVEEALTAALESEAAQRLLEGALASPGTERLLEGTLESPATERLLQDMLASPATERLLQGALASPATERLLVAVLESRLVPELTDRLLRSPEMQAVLEYVATSPEVRRALTQQSSTLADEVAGGLRTRTETLDDVAERTVRGWLRRPRPATE